MRLLVFIVLIILFSNFAYSYEVSVSKSVDEKVIAGERFNFAVKVEIPPSEELKNLNLEYEVRNEESKLIAYKKFLKPIRGETSFLDNIIIPSSVSSGEYSFKMISSIDGEEQIDGLNFSVGVLKESNNALLFIIMLTLVLILGVLETFVLISINKNLKTY